MSGKLNLKENFEKYLKAAEEMGVKNVGALACGPQRLIDEVIGQCEETNRKGKVSFNYHYETFDFLRELI